MISSSHFAKTKIAEVRSLQLSTDVGAGAWSFWVIMDRPFSDLSQEERTWSLWVKREGIPLPLWKWGWRSWDIEISLLRRGRKQHSPSFPWTNSDFTPQSNALLYERIDLCDLPCLPPQWPGSFCSCRRGKGMHIGKCQIYRLRTQSRRSVDLNRQWSYDCKTDLKEIRIAWPS